MVMATVTVIRENLPCQVCINVDSFNLNLIQCRCPMMLIFEVDDITCAQTLRSCMFGLELSGIGSMRGALKPCGASSGLAPGLIVSLSSCGLDQSSR
jgi:hypothetical protein